MRSGSSQAIYGDTSVRSSTLRRLTSHRCGRCTGEANTLFEQQQLACQALGFRWMAEHQRRYLVSVLREELEHTIDRDRLLLFTRRWLYEHQLIIVHDRMLRRMIAASVQQFETELAASIQASVGAALLERWRARLTAEHG